MSQYVYHERQLGALCHVLSLALHVLDDVMVGFLPASNQPTNQRMPDVLFQCVHLDDQERELAHQERLHCVSEPLKKAG
eukprot:838437-Amphidinium_carterae.1